MNAESKKRADELRAYLMPNQVVALNQVTGKVTIFDAPASNPAENIERWGWKVVYSYVPPGIKQVSSAPEGTPIENQRVQVSKPGRGRKPKVA